MAAAAGYLVGRPWQQSPPVPTTRPRSRPAYRLARLSELVINSGSAAMSCRSSVHSCMNLHEQVSERNFRTGRNPRYI